ncbi:MAG: putative toxin-antitoxin system toxin component, PIN family [Pyrinomonadaceae bacterium]|nr:putative toxin-antitoxin system toxin component, PIN family [Pyrinomonadaceae bacterium]
MRIVFDTNVLIAAFIARGVCHQLLEHCVSHHTLVTSESILNELREKLVDKFKYTPETAEEVDKLLRSRMSIVAHAALASPVCRDADDDNILATAVAGDADCILTGDKVLLVLKEFEGIDIISPGEFQAYETSR